MRRPLRQWRNRCSRRRRANGRNGKNAVNGKKRPLVTELPKINNLTDTRDILAHAAKDAKQHDYFIVDVDAHVTETAFWSEVVDRMESDVYKQMARAFKERGNAAGPAQRHAGNALPGRVRPHPASGAARRSRAGRPHPCPGDAGAARHGFDGHRLHGGIPDPDAGAGHASADRDGGRDRQRLQQMADRRNPAAGFPHQGDAVSAVQSSGSLRKDGGDLRQHAGRDRFFGHLDPVPRRQSRQLHAALCGDPGHRQAARLPFRLPLGRPVDAAVQSLHLDACDLVRLLQPHPSDQLDHQRAAGALSRNSKYYGSRAGWPGCRSSCSGSIPNT